MMKLNKITAALILSAVALPLYTSAATLSANDSTNTISGLDSSQMISTDNGHKWKAYTNESQNNFPGTLTVTVAVKDDQAINSVEYDPSVAYSEAGTVVRYNGYYWTNQWWANPGELPGSNAVWTRGDKIGINTLATFKFTPYTGQEAIDFQNQQKANVAAQRKVTGYFPEWGVYDAHENFTPDKIDFSLLTHLNYGFGIVKSGEVEIHDTEQGPLLLAELDEMTEEAGVSYMASIGGWNNSEEGVFEEATATDAGVEKLANSMMAFMLEWGFDGIDVDWEYPDSDTEKTQFTKLIQSLRSKLDAQGKKDDKYYQLSAAVTTNHNNIKFINPEVTTPLLDSVNVMAYDIHGAFDPITGHNAPLYANSQDADLKLNSSSAMKEYADTYKVPKNKLLMGIPFYGRGWGDVEPTEIVQGLPGLFAPGSATIHGAWDDDGQFTGTNPWYLLKQKAASGDYTRYWDRESRVPYLYNAATKEFLTYDDPQSVREKVDFINNEGYGGAIIWDLSGDTPDHELGKIVKDVKEYVVEDSDVEAVYIDVFDSKRRINVNFDNEKLKESSYQIEVDGESIFSTSNGKIYNAQQDNAGEVTTVYSYDVSKYLAPGKVVTVKRTSPDEKVLKTLTVTEAMLENNRDPIANEDITGLRIEKRNGVNGIAVDFKRDKLDGNNSYYAKISGEDFEGNYVLSCYVGKCYYASRENKNDNTSIIHGGGGKLLKAGNEVIIERRAPNPGVLMKMTITEDMLK
ncbi:glycosyl hydrolase family 18 protein [Chimaeribacter arupi]|uniref:glycosyl hydrolase family 18 protein n=1 Tax=Chimaeribacter arupi TaxID=2060066 RepID=UPI0029467F47|nr:glycosyl hydrolase family 18 protein [Chimaeribacter arupi]MDV5140533.1 glycosyl hydrolase family 18 protein [Chimaeribacter arupi]